MKKYQVLRNKDIMGLRPSIVFYDQWKSGSACPSDMHDDWHLSGGCDICRW